MCTTCVPGTYEGHKGSSDPPGLVLQTVASCCVGAGNLTCSLQDSQQGFSVAWFSLQPQFSFHYILLSIRYFVIATTTTKTTLRHVAYDNETLLSRSKRRLVFKQV